MRTVIVRETRAQRDSAEKISKFGLKESDRSNMKMRLVILAIVAVIDCYCDSFILALANWL